MHAIIICSDVLYDVPFRRTRLQSVNAPVAETGTVSHLAYCGESSAAVVYLGARTKIDLEGKPKVLRTCHPGSQKFGPRVLRTLRQSSQNIGPKFSEPWNKVLRSLEKSSQNPQKAQKPNEFLTLPNFSEPWTKVLRTLRQSSQNLEPKFSEP